MCSVRDRYNYEPTMKTNDKSNTLLNKNMHAEGKTSMWINFFIKEVITDLWISVSLKKTSWVVENIPWSSSSQDNARDHQCFFIIHIDFQNIIRIDFYIKSQKHIYCAHTGVDPGMSTIGDASYWHPNHSSRANISQTVSVEWNNSPHMRPLSQAVHRSP